ncbi:glycosyl hydrolase [Arthrobacter sp. zg-Y20]|uniref:glycoside hydrolase family 76 protein n=1 Tax=unclassified Arthrobacter TaxID=235627 RepID=UPI001D150B08|nr:MULTISPECIES: glycoside hydrolase family 76 protein [unclassified Arthrobacter]MCC3276328.1 glycosyl hydrolase [Arthrobacter sp. zg-Y20]MDK1316487.1 glycoside hydrolase family 76 protein [Arthrobacter sp. zg.Y20]WIB06530.1 glycoside hydrolase family 76 protein [Arthrobacter sp. zg-Y20]
MLFEDPALDADDRAEAAARTVSAAFGRQLAGLPGTHLAATRHPLSRLAELRQPWHYWWQAHYLDSLVDAALRERRTGTPFRGPEHPAAAELAPALVRTIGLRNRMRYTNRFYDDMAWLALSVGRLNSLSGSRDRQRPYRKVLQTLDAALVSAHTNDLGGGIYWNRDRNFKNTPATAPAALHFVRTGSRDRAQALVDWLNATLLDPETGLYMDGVKVVRGRPQLESRIFTYNQGPVLAALLELGGSANLARAQELVAAVRQHLTDDAGPSPVLRTHGTGDGGLFTGILARYLAQAAVSPALPEPSRRTASELVDATAQALWEGRAKRGEWELFSTHPLQPAANTYPGGSTVELSTQLQAWMVLEASARVRRADLDG